MLAEGTVSVAVIDDDPLATTTLKNEISRYPNLRLVGTATTCADGSALIVRKRPKLLFLDVELPDGLGMDFLHDARPLLPAECHVVFYTAYDKYIINALRERAFDFLTKPLDPQQFSLVMGRVNHDFVAEKDGNAPSQIVINTASGDMLLLKISDVSYFTYDENRRMWSVMLDSGKMYQLRRTIKSDKILTYSPLLVQTDKSHVINVDKLIAVKCGRCVLRGNVNGAEDIPISRANLAAIKSRLPKM